MHILDGTRTRNLAIRSRAPYPLGHKDFFFCFTLCFRLLFDKFKRKAVIHLVFPNTGYFQNAGAVYFLQAVLLCFGGRKSAQERVLDLDVALARIEVEAVRRKIVGGVNDSGKHAVL